MILKLKNGCYIDFDKGYEFGAQAQGEGGARVWCNYSRGSNVTVMDGYETVEEAQDALDEFMSGQDVSVFPSPVSDEDDVDDESEEDEFVVDYEDMNLDELRAEASNRTPPLPTSGKKVDLIARLREDDERQHPANSTDPAQSTTL